MYIIGVAGYSGSGKTEFSNLLVKQNPRLFACHLDEIWFELAYENRNWFVKQFGEKIFKQNGRLDYEYYCSSDNTKIQECRTWTTPEIIERFYKKVEALRKTHDIFIADFHSLPRTSIWKQCNKRVFVTSNAQERHNRLQMREYLPCTPQEAIVRDEKTDQSLAANVGTDYITVYNDYTENLEIVAKEFLNGILKEIQ
jgi:dephospho-CoA kinase